jgi:hypothetical protein
LLLSLQTYVTVPTAFVNVPADTDPVGDPLHARLVEVQPVIANADGWRIVTEHVSEPQASETVSVYVPAIRFATEGVVPTTTPFESAHEYNIVPLALVSVPAVTVPVFPPKQVTSVCEHGDMVN